MLGVLGQPPSNEVGEQASTHVLQSVSNYKCKLECNLKVAKHGQEADVGPLPLSLSVSLSLSLSPGLQPRADYNT